MKTYPTWDQMPSQETKEMERGRLKTYPNKILCTKRVPEENVSLLVLYHLEWQDS